MDKVMYLFLAGVILLGCWNTVASVIFDSRFNYRERLAVVSARSSGFQPDASLATGAPLGFQAHALLAFALFALWPFTGGLNACLLGAGRLRPRPYIVLSVPRQQGLGTAWAIAAATRRRSAQPRRRQAMSDLAAAETSGTTGSRKPTDALDVDASLVDEDHSRADQRIAHGYDRPMAPVRGFILRLAVRRSRGR